MIANGILVNEDANGNGVLNNGEDSNNNKVLDRGLWFQADGAGVRVTLQAQRRSGPREHPQMSELSEVIVPRN